MKKSIPSRRSIIALAVILSIIMYLAGVFSGLYANKIIEKKVEEDISFLRNYMDIASLDLKNMILLQLLMEQMQDKCLFSEIYLSNLRNQLEPYWQKLPPRLETYDRSRKITPEYITLKREYVRLSLRIWLIAKKNNEECDSNLVPVLYFYSGDCQTCVKQGEIFDELNVKMKKINKSLVVFPIDKNFEDDSVYLLKKYYNITHVPTVVIGNKVITGKVISSDKMIDVIEN